MLIYRYPIMMLITDAVRLQVCFTCLDLKPTAPVAIRCWHSLSLVPITRYALRAKTLKKIQRLPFPVCTYQQ